MDKKLGKVIWIIGSMTLAMAAFYYMPEIQKKIADKIYRKM